jgi:hypothetical protein
MVLLPNDYRRNIKRVRPQSVGCAAALPPDTPPEKGEAARARGPRSLAAQKMVTPVSKSATDGEQQII